MEETSYCLTIILTLASNIFGAATTWLFAWLYYKKAGDELKQEAEQLKTISRGVVYMLEHPEAKIEVTRDDAGNLTGLRVSSSGSAEAGSTVQGVAKPPED
jgi:hypothetical protein